MKANPFPRPSIPLLLSLISGIGVGSWLSLPVFWVYLLIFLISGYLIYNISGKARFSLLPAVLFFLLGYLSIQTWVAPNFPSNHIIHFVDGKRGEMSGRISSTPVRSQNRTKFILDVERLSLTYLEETVCGKIRVTVRGETPALSLGDQVAISGKIRSIRNFNNPGRFDYRRFMAFQGVYGSVYTNGDGIAVIKKNEEGSFFSGVESFRKGMITLIENELADEDHRGIFKALLLGERTGISPETRETLNRAGVAHILAISGLHIGIVATAAFFFFSWAAARFKFLLWSAWTRKAAAGLALVPVLAYGLISGMSPSTQRAVIMVFIFLMTFWVTRAHDSKNALALAALFILIYYPPALFSISFQLSFSAVVAIIYGFPLIRPVIDSNDTWVIKTGKRFLSFLAVSGLAIIGTTPLVALYFNQISLVAIFSNCLMLPLIGFWVIPVGLLSVTAYPFSVGLAAFLLKMSALALHVGFEGIKIMADLPFAAIKTVTPSYLEIGCFYLFFGGLMSIKKRPGAKVLVLSALIVMAADVGYWWYQRYGRQDMRVTVIDVGLGSAALLELPKGYTVLIDGGGFSDNTVFDMGARVVAPVLWRKKILTVDQLVLSHPNSDHLNGLIYIADHFKVKRFWSNGEKAATRGYQSLIEVCRNRHIHMPEFADIPRRLNINGVTFEVLNPPVAFLKMKMSNHWRNKNNNSIVIKATFGSVSFMFPGDIMAAAEREMALRYGSRLQSSVLIAPHHGSKTSSTAAFLDQVKPKAVIISAGWKNRYGYPAPKVTQRYRERQSQILSTGRHGAIRVVTDGDDFWIKSYLKVDAE
jgi:competence protein ComEC